jgi:hypothetical protein
VNSESVVLAQGEAESLSLQVDSCILRVKIRNGLVDELDFDGLTDAQEIEFSRLLATRSVGFSLRHAAEHAVVHAMDDFLGLYPEKRAKGIVTLRSLGAWAQAPTALIRQIYSQHASSKDTGWNFESLVLTTEWVAQQRSQKLEKLRTWGADFSTGQKLDSDAVRVTDIDRFERVSVEFADSVEVPAKPKLLMGFERYLRHVSGEQLEVFLTDRKDLNRIRRL